MTKSHSFLHNLIKPFKFGSSKEGSDEEELGRTASPRQKIFPYETLVAATKNFHSRHKLGEGGFGSVYKLDDGRRIAVKRLSQSSNQSQRIEKFMNEARLLARVHHPNVVNLLGYCVHGTTKLLVYDYLPLGSLEKNSFESHVRKQLDWKRRFDIITGIASGLLYLHKDSNIPIIHRNIKPRSILLDDNWMPKIANFDIAHLSYLFPEDQTHVTTRIMGTMHTNFTGKTGV
ncbi:cysteine-rich receptor-like protein kinase 43 isoform X2 [Prosopis cineraria]|uniref:cysteine-rich receptor-like protein kinase 43 isoform X2 n=1 Tax=Prosopis cineraria TaxID=364024 RepID=UPI00240F7E0F|nr:cysteine-rich receptor-like protein kinase 43 isoform X2 [Prosopis cineraria]